MQQVNEVSEALARTLWDEVAYSAICQQLTIAQIQAICTQTAQAAMQQVREQVVQVAKQAATTTDVNGEGIVAATEDQT